jgi:glycosyltransferase involved in cell wall biosynthesis
MLAGLPVVATDVGSVSEAVVDGSTGCLVAPDDAEALAGAIGALAKDGDRRQAMGELGRERALKLFTADVMASRYEALYNEVLA